MTAPVAGGVAGVRDTLTVAANNPVAHGGLRGLQNVMHGCAARLDEAIRTVEAMADAADYALRTRDDAGALSSTAEHNLSEALRAYRGEAATPAKGGAPDCVPGPLDLSAPPRVWLQVDTAGDNDDRSEAMPRDAWDQLSWHYESIGGQEVEYVRADLAATPAGGGDLPELPEPYDKLPMNGLGYIGHFDVYTADQMRAYGQQCRLASTGSAPAPSGDAKPNLADRIHGLRNAARWNTLCGLIDKRDPALQAILTDTLNMGAGAMELYVDEAYAAAPTQEPSR